MLKRVLYCTLILNITNIGEIYASSVLPSEYEEQQTNNIFKFHKNTSYNNTNVDTSDITNNTVLKNTSNNNDQFIYVNTQDLQSIISCNQEFQNIINKYKAELENNNMCHKKGFHSREKINVVRELLRFLYQYTKSQLNVDDLKYNSITGLWTCNGQSDFNYSIGIGLYHNIDLTNSNQIIIKQIESNPILSIGLDNYNNIINVHRYFQKDETLQEVVKQILSNYYNINDFDINNIISNKNNKELISGNYKISYESDVNAIKILPIQEVLDKVELEINIGSVNDNYITITKHFKDETDLTNNQQSLITKILTNYSNKLNNDTSVNIPEISYDEQSNLFKFGNDNYYNFGNDTKYAIYGEYKYEPTISIYPIVDSILTINTNRLPSIILSEFIKNYNTAHKKIDLKLKKQVKDLSQQGKYAQSAKILHGMKDYHNAALYYVKAANSEYNPQKQVEYYTHAAEIFYDINDYFNTASNYNMAAYYEEDEIKKMDYYNKEIEIYKQMKNYGKIADIYSYIAYNESNVQKKVEYCIKAAEIYLENKDYYNAAMHWNNAADNENNSDNKVKYYLNAGETYTMIKDYNTVVNTYEKAGNAYRSAAEVDNISPEERIKYYTEAAKSYNNAQNYEQAILNYLLAAEANNNLVSKNKDYKNADKALKNTSFYIENNSIKYSWEIFKNKYSDNTDSKEYKAIVNRISAL